MNRATRRRQRGAPMTSSAQLVSVGPAAFDGQPDHDSARVAAALGTAGVPVAGRVIIDDDEAASTGPCGAILARRPSRW
jgi:hypothetical protein